MTTLSVLLPVYNAAPYLAETLDSLLNQTRPADQIIIVNDGSTDRSLELMQQFQGREQRIQLINQHNTGVSGARNRGLASCEGDFIALMDADDICHPNRFAVQLDAMQKQRLDLCGSWLHTFGRKSRKIRYPCRDAELKWNYLYLGRTIANPTTMMRRQALGTTRYRAGMAWAEDYGFFLDVLLGSPEIRMGNVPRVLLNYRTHSQQASQRLQEQNRHSIVALLQDLLPKAGIHANPSLLQCHYQIWQQQTPLSLTQLRDYLPLMSELSTWLLLHTNDRRLATAHWAALAKRHRAIGGNTHELIAQAAGASWPLSWRAAERLLTYVR